MAIICEMAILAIVARIYYRHTAQAYIGQLASKYRRQTQNLRDTFKSLSHHSHHTHNHNQSANDVVINVATSQPSADETDGNRVTITAAAAENSSSLDVEQVTRTKPLDEVRGTDADSGCSSFDENEIIVRF